jgi:peptidoglycan/LPS O-acetylase OafA/YrhL
VGIGVVHDAVFDIGHGCLPAFRVSLAERRGAAQGLGGVFSARAIHAKKTAFPPDLPLPELQRLKYRTDIDGLRAIAVLAVLAFHIHAVEGGFVGVDIFFVISGYLISTIIFDEMSVGTFSLARFYERRIKRILPALLVMLTVVLIVSLLVLTPADTVGVAKTAAAAALSVSNIYFAWNATFFQAYFNAPAATQPLLHTWSLGVEEQFYLVFPLLLMACRRFVPNLLISFVVVVFAISLIVSTISAQQRYDAAFYLLHDRAWELALGTMLALKAIPAVAARWWREAIAGFGLAALLGSIFVLDTHWPIPGLSLMPACLGTAAVIHSGEGTLTARLLSLRPMVFVGLISYSLYLWHWPVFVFEQTNWLFYAGESRLIEKSSVLAISFVLATLSWKYVELPFRTRSWKPSRIALFGGAATCVALVSTAALALSAAGGLPTLLPDRQQALGAYLHYARSLNDPRDLCTSDHPEEFDEEVRNCLSVSKTKKNVLLLGDSHASHLSAGLHDVFTDQNILQASAHSCRPTLGIITSSYQACEHLMDYVFNDFLRRHGKDVNLVILSAQWQFDYADDLFGTAAELKRRHIPVVIFGPIEAYEKQLPRLLILQQRLHDPSVHVRYVEADRFTLDRALAKRAAAEQVPYISVIGALCKRTDCVTMAGAVPLQYDNAHLTYEGSKLLITRIADKIRAAEH